MGGQSSSTQTQQSQTAPWQAAQPMLQGILGQLGAGLNNTGLTSEETGALDTLQSNAAQGNPFAGQIGDYAQSLLNGGGANAQAGNVQGNLGAFQSQLSPMPMAAWSAITRRSQRSSRRFSPMSAIP